MSNAKMHAVDDIKKLGRMLKGLLDFAEEIEKVGSIENAGNEASARLLKLKADEADAHAKFLAAKEKADAEQSIADGLVAEAKEKAEQVLKLAQEKAAEIVGQAHTKAYESKTASEVARAKALQDAKAVEAEIEVMKKEKAELSAIISGLNAEFEALKKRIGYVQV